MRRAIRGMVALPLPARRPIATRPAAATIRINGTRVALRHWTAEEWAATPDGDRPAGTIPDDRGGRFAVAAE